MVDDKHSTESEDTTGHNWDGISELNTPLPRWWLYTLYATIVWGVIYTIAFPAWPGITGATAGLLGWSTRAEVAEEIETVENALAPINAQLVATPLENVSDDPVLQSYAVSSGAAVFRTWCAQCHGAGAAGADGYPNLLDDDWLWGGDIDAIHETVRFGIRSEEVDETRYSAMPAFGRDDLLEDAQIDQVVQFVLSLSQDVTDAAAVEAGAVVYEDNCAACHGETGKGDRSQGAPNLADAIWLYGGTKAQVKASIVNGPFGMMPDWGDRLSDAQVRAVSIYVHQLGGGE